jgi:lipopolysaccharide/colanic/teichoic acid biosynthesis glycosyltransferase
MPEKTLMPVSDDAISSPVIDQTAFMRMLVAERMRADRSNRPVGLLLVSGATTLAPDVVAAVRTAVRRSDVLGWFEWPAAVGVTLPELRTSPPIDPLAVERRIWQRLQQRLRPGDADRCSIRLHVHPQPRTDAAAPIDPQLFPDIASHHQKSRIKLSLKRGVDVVGSGALLALSSPWLAMMVLTLKAARNGPIFCSQPRLGLMMKPFQMLSFATAPGARERAFDWLPQLWNVLRGDMSLVGPRPAVPSEVVHYKPWHCRRLLEAKPGLTGEWRLSSGSPPRQASAVDEMARRDLHYVRTWSLWADLKILSATSAALLRKPSC